MTWQDPIVQEVREAGEKLAKEANYDVHTFFQNLRANEKQLGCLVVSKPPKPVSSSHKRKTG